MSYTGTMYLIIPVIVFVLWLIFRHRVVPPKGTGTETTYYRED